jgi:predicted MFS family arabinose efflux permease
MLSEWFVYRWGVKVIFVSIPIICAAIAIILTRLPGPLAPRGRRPQPFSEALRASLPGLRSVLALTVFFGLCFSAWNSFLAPAVRGIGPGAVSAFGLGYALGAVLSRLGISHRLDTGPRRLWAILSLVAYSLGLDLIPHAIFNWQLAGLGLVCGMVHGIYYPSLSSIAAERFHPSHEGQAMSLYISASALGMFVGPPIWGALADRSGYSRMFTVAGALLAGSALTFVFFQRRFSEGRRASESQRLQPSSEESI